MKQVQRTLSKFDLDEYPLLFRGIWMCNHNLKKKRIWKIDPPPGTRKWLDFLPLPPLPLPRFHFQHSYILTSISYLVVIASYLKWVTGIWSIRSRRTARWLKEKPAAVVFVSYRQLQMTMGIVVILVAITPTNLEAINRFLITTSHREMSQGNIRTR